MKGRVREHFLGYKIRVPRSPTPAIQRYSRSDLATFMNDVG